MTMNNFFQVTPLTLLAFFSVSSVGAAPLPPRANDLSPSFSTLSKPIVSPYYVYFGNLQTKLADAFDSLNMKSATIGFASAPKGKCALDDDLKVLVSDANAFVAKGGALSLSFGGNLQDQTIPRQHVQQACTDVDGLVKLIEGAMTQFKTHNVEFDIEDNSLLQDEDAKTRLAKALAQVKKDMPDTFVTYTVGTGTGGMPGDQLKWVQAAKDNGLKIDALTLMTMNMGGDDNVKDSQTAVKGGAAQLAKIYSLSTGDAMKKMGMLPAIGVDNDGKIIDLKGIATLSQFAKSNSMALMSYWNFNRDFPGDVGSDQQVLTDSSSPDQKKPSEFLTTILGSINDSKASDSSTPDSPAISKGAVAKLTSGGLLGDNTPLAGGGAKQVVTDTTSAPPPPSDQQPGQKASLPPAGST